MSDLISEGVASGEDAMTLLDNPRTRNLFLDDLFEVRPNKKYVWFRLHSKKIRVGRILFFLKTFFHGEMY